MCDDWMNFRYNKKSSDSRDRKQAHCLSFSRVLSKEWAAYVLSNFGKVFTFIRKSYKCYNDNNNFSCRILD